ncbi:MAG TPA: DUF3618 domain-containing protein [Stellaceae bacterium]|nr:DUF3618 domain-containing protein [Stellaceae bacterium]
MSRKTKAEMEEIEQQIGRVRAELGVTLDTLASELAPRHLVARGVDMINGFFSTEEPGSGGFRADPLPLALIGLGLAWLAAENSRPFRRSAAQRGDDAPAPAEDIERPVADYPVADYLGHMPDDTDHGESKESWLHRAAEATQGGFKSILAEGGAVAGRAGGWWKALERNPLALGAAGLAAGAVIAMLLPPTRREQEMVAGARTDLWQKAEELGHRAAAEMRDWAERPPRSRKR